MRFLEAVFPLCLALLAGCSIKRMAVDRIGNALAGTAGVYASDDDPDLVRDASPFALKTIEGLLQESPAHPGLLLSACSGFTQYAHAFLQDEADYAEASDPARAAALRLRARKLYLRARNYGLRGLEAALPGFRDQLRAAPDAALARAGREQVPLLYYTAAAWASAFALDVSDSSLAVDQTLMEKLARRALALDPAWDAGAAHEFLAAWEAGHAQAGGSVARARAHFQEAVRLSGGLRASAYVTFAEAVALEAQDRAGFEALLNDALRVDPDRDPGRRTAILVAQRRARWLLGRSRELFNEPEETKP
ncbi:TRAP transporter TatT component family protein [Mesoterricola silvestris]|uniref:Lipoprotein n=1 Tax=Mesoterricola silvestris TaxID=2927979 RepID=A0AA48GK08_9BACT|nr:TRAP transporter TatT component family protein [Mesoterricola silvestris]BDU72747.1 lipoprotein [Mesoterricola silvestris]